MNNKIIEINILKKEVKLLKKKGLKVGLCHGVFDIIHFGHINHFKKAKKLCDVLIVSITSDRYVNKGFNRPAFSEKIRMQSVAELQVVDKVILSDFSSSLNILKIIKPDFYFKGSEYKNFKNDLTGKIITETQVVKKYGGKTIFTNEPSSSSSYLINKYFNTLNDNQVEYLKKLKNKYNFKNILELTKKIRNLKILVLGETILDEYSFSEVMGKSGKESYLAIKEIKNEMYLGGAAAIAKHLSSFSDNVKLLSMVGQKKENFSFIKKQLGKINSYFLKKKNSPTIVKKRYLDFVNNNKLIGVYKINDKELDKNQDKILIKKFRQFTKNIDLLIISDYGHGFINKNLIKLIENKKKLSFLNAQVNSANLGYHTVQKYKKINCLIINELELRHEMRDKDTDVITLAKILQIKNKINKIVITRGKLGAIIIDNKTKSVFNCPAFTTNVVDKVGAGDTMLAIICLFMKIGTPDDLTLFLGNVAGSFSVQSMGNSSYIEKDSFLKQVDVMLK